MKIDYSSVWSGQIQNITVRTHRFNEAVTQNNRSAFDYFIVGNKQGGPTNCDRDGRILGGSGEKKKCDKSDAGEFHVAHDNEKPAPAQNAKKAREKRRAGQLPPNVS